MIGRYANDSKNTDTCELLELTEEFAIAGLTVIDIYTGKKTVMDIFIKNEKIDQMALQGTLTFPENIRVINAAGQYAIPGLCDMHIHLTIWPEFQDHLSTLLIANGVTSVRDMGGQLDDILAFRERATRPNVVAPRLWIAGPIIDGSPRRVSGNPAKGLADISVAVDTPEEAKGLVDELVKSRVDFVKTYEMLRPEVFTGLLQQAQVHQLQAAGHLPIRMTIPQVLQVEPHYDIQHLGGTCSGMKFECVDNPERLLAERIDVLDKQIPGERGIELANKILRNTAAMTPSKQNEERCAELIQQFVEKGTWHTPTLVNSVGVSNLGFNKDVGWKTAFRYLPKERQLDAEEHFEKHQDDIKEHAWGQWKLETVSEMHKAGVRFLAGTDSPPTPFYTPGFALHFELKALVQAGLSPLEALQAATINGAEFFNATDNFGSIEEGKYADMVLLDADPLADINNTQRIASVISRGRFFDRNTLDALLASVVEESEQ